MHSTHKKYSVRGVRTCAQYLRNADRQTAVRHRICDIVGGSLSIDPPVCRIAVEILCGPQGRPTGCLPDVGRGGTVGQRIRGARFKGFATQEAAGYFFRTGRESAAETTTIRAPPQQQQRPQQQHRRQENWAYVLYSDGG